MSQESDQAAAKEAAAQTVQDAKDAAKAVSNAAASGPYNPNENAGSAHGDDPIDAALEVYVNHEK